MDHTRRFFHGGTRWNGLSVSRWKPDPTEDRWGQFIFLRDTATNDWWSTTTEPRRAEGEQSKAVFGDEKAEFLVKSRRNGLSYKKIRELGGFTEELSTLRGRYRVLTKHKDHRKRNPQWDGKDVSLKQILSQASAHY